MSADAPLSPGTVLGDDFELKRPFARGGMGTVYGAVQRSSARECAVKVMHPELIDQKRSRERFEREAELCARIESDHVVKIIASGIDAGSDRPWIAMELVEGDDLEKVCRRRGAFTVEESRVVLAQLFDGIGAAHAVGIVHRDLKPQNILLADAEGDLTVARLKLLDFGISKQSNEQGTDTTAAVGSPLWMAPEQAQRGRLTPATDVFALALIAFRLLTGRYYWRSAGQARPAIKEMLIELLMKPYPPASSRAKDLGAPAPPMGFDAWFDKALERDPTRRYPDARAAWAALEPILARAPARELTPDELHAPLSEPDDDAVRTIPINAPRHSHKVLGAIEAEAVVAPETKYTLPSPLPSARSSLRSSTPTPLPELLAIAEKEREATQPRSSVFVATVVAVMTLLVVAVVVLVFRYHG